MHLCLGALRMLSCQLHLVTQSQLGCQHLRGLSDRIIERSHSCPLDLICYSQSDHLVYFHHFVYTVQYGSLWPHRTVEPSKRGKCHWGTGFLPSLHSNSRTWRMAAMLCGTVTGAEIEAPTDWIVAQGLTEKDSCRIWTQSKQCGNNRTYTSRLICNMLISLQIFNFLPF